MNDRIKQLALDTAYLVADAVLEGMGGHSKVTKLEAIAETVGDRMFWVLADSPEGCNVQEIREAAIWAAGEVL